MVNVCTLLEVGANSRLGAYANKYIPLISRVFGPYCINYGPTFFPSIYGPSAKRAGHKSMEKNEDP